MRLFVAVDLPEAVKGSLDAAAATVRGVLPRARWVRPSQFHLTLAFLGEVDGGRVPALSRALREKLEPESGFRAHLGSLGSFPNTGAVRVLWAGVEPAVRFARLAELVQDGVSAADLAAEDKPFRSHVTLARCDPAWPPHLRKEVAAAAGTFGERVGGVSFACEQVQLFSSVLASGGPTYRVEGSFQLQSP